MSKILAAPEKWSEIPSGDVIARQISISINDLCSKFHINEILAIGALAGCLDFTRSLSVLACSHQGGPRTQIIADEMNLPIKSKALQCALLPFLLDFHPYPHEVLREAARVVDDDGYLAICGFNPFSLWGLCHYTGHFRRRFDWGGRFIAVHRIIDWLTILQFETCSVDYLFYRPPVQSMRCKEQLSWMEPLGRNLLHRCGSVYVLLAAKRVIPVRPILLDNKSTRHLASLTATSFNCKSRHVRIKG